MSRKEYINTYVGFPVLWCSKLPTEINLSTIEAEYIVLSQAMCDIIPYMVLLLLLFIWTQAR